MIRRAALALTLGLSACSISAGLPRASFTASRGTASPSASSPSSGTSASSSSPSASSPSSSSNNTSDNDNAAALALVVPDVMGKTPDEARAIVKAAGFVREVELSTMLSCNGARTVGRISCQNPAAGTRVGRNDWVQIAVHTVTKLKTWYIEPEQLRPLIGRPLAEVKQRLRALGHVGSVSIREDVAPTATCHDDLVCAFNQDIYRLDDGIYVSLALPPGAE